MVSRDGGAARVVLGLGGTVDYEVEWDTGAVTRLAAEHGITADELDPATAVTSERDLLVVLLAFLRDGVGGERFVVSSDVVEAFAAHFTTRVTLGGTAVRAGLALAALGLPSTLHLVSTDEHVRRLLPPECSSVTSATGDTTDPHLIVQYPRGARVVTEGLDLTAPHANRAIFVNDAPNRELRLSPDLGGVLADARVLLVSGMNTIADPELLRRRLAELRLHLHALPAGARVVYEDGGFHVPAFGLTVARSLADVVDVHSLNEDELAGYVGRRVVLDDALDVVSAVAELQRTFPARVFVVHTHCWALAVGEHADAYAESLRAGVLLAGTRYRHGDAVTAADCEALAALPVDERRTGVAGEVERVLRATVGPAVCVPARRLDVAAPTTIGLGDTFVGGFVAALAGLWRPPVASPTSRAVPVVAS